MKSSTADNLTIRRVPLESLELDPANARSHGDRNLDAIRASLQRFGQTEPLVVQKQSGRVIGGNGRLVAMRAMGWNECDVVEVDLDDLTATALALALNRTAELAEWEPETLGRLLEALRAEDSLDGVGFDEAEVEEILANLGGMEDLDVLQDAVPDPPDDPTTLPGDLWILGRHRLLCGDSGSPTDLDRLLEGEPIHLVNTDPPYNVRVEPRSNNAQAAGLSSFGSGQPGRGPGASKLRPKDRPLQNDFVSPDEFDRLLGAWFANAARVLLPGHAFYIWGGYSNLGNYPSALDEAGLYFSQGIVWDKQHPVLSRKDLMGAFELCFYGWREGAAHRFFGPNNATDLWHLKKVNPQSMVHLTEKPVELAARAMQYSSKRGENVLDLFGGSGSTLMAAEQADRRAFLMEIDLPYCDVIIERWQNLTGASAVHEESGQTFEVAARERSLEETG